MNMLPADVAGAITNSEKQDQSVPPFNAQRQIDADRAPPYQAQHERAQPLLPAECNRSAKVVMLVYNPCINDSRVIREAEALAQAGYSVTVLAKRDPTAPIRENRNGVDYRRVLSVTDTWPAAARRLARLAAYVRRDPYRSTQFQRMAAAIVTLGRRRNFPARENLESGEKADLRGSAQRATLDGRAAIAAFRRTLDSISAFARRIGRGIVRSLRLTKGSPTNLLRRTKASPLTAKRSPESKPKKATTGSISSKSRQRQVVLAKARIKTWATMRVKRPLILRAKRLVASAFIFEVVDIAMRRQLLRLRPDIIHAHDLMTLPTASRVASDIGARLVYDSHELEMHRNADYSKYAWRRRGRMEKRHIRKADLVITVSDSIADHLRDAYRIPRPSVVMNTPPLGIKGSTAELTIRRKLGLRKTTPLAIYVGSVTVNRGIEMCVKALAHYPELHFATIGPRRKPNEVELLEIAENLGVSERFHMIDPVPADAVVSFVRTADVSVLPIQNVCLSYYYCMPNKLFESVVGGLPVAVADLVELRKFVERYECGLIMDETDPRDIARAIRQVMENRPTFLLGDEARAEVQATYTWPAQAAKLAEAYERIPLSVGQRERTRGAAV